MEKKKPVERVTEAQEAARVRNKAGRKKEVA
jgi:hypothetical protein